MHDFSEVYELYFSDVYRYLLSICRNESLTEELTQQTFFTALKSSDKFDGKCKLYVWLWQIVKNSYLTYLNKHKRLMHTDEIAEESTESVKASRRSC